MIDYFNRSAVTFRADVDWHEAYNSANQQEMFIVGSLSLGCGNLGGAGGWAMGGGHSAFPSKFVLDTDISIHLAVLEFMI